MQACSYWLGNDPYYVSANFNFQRLILSASQLSVNLAKGVTNTRNKRQVRKINMKIKHSIKYSVNTLVKYKQILFYFRPILKMILLLMFSFPLCMNELFESSNQDFRSSNLFLNSGFICLIGCVVNS